MKPSTSIILVLSIIVITSCKNTNYKDQELKNLESFIKLYGYVRYFYPDSIFTTYTWNKFTFYGLNKVKYCKSNNELIDSLNSVFKPIVSELIIKKTPIQNSRTRKLKNNDTILFWQHYGLKPDKDQEYLPYRSKIVKYSNNHFISDSLFSTHFDSIQYYQTEISENIYIEFPLVLNQEISNNINIQNFKKYINKYKTDTISVENKELADICVYWNIIQHFYPYHHESNTHWNKTLKSIIIKILDSQNTHDKNYFLFKLAKLTKDSHFLTIPYSNYIYELPVKTTIINDTAIVEKSYDTTLFKTGDIIKSINSKTIFQLCQLNSIFHSGSKHNINYWTSRKFHETKEAKYCDIEILRNKKLINLKTKTERNWSKRKILESKELHKNIYYINLETEHNLDSLISKAQLYDALIIDIRYGNSNHIEMHHLLEHSIKDSLTYPFNFQIPEIIMPDNIRITTRLNKLSKPDTNYVVFPRKPFINCKFVLLMGSDAISYHETVTQLAKIHKLATIIGEKTGGCNGNINISQLPSYTTIHWTGMKTTNWDGSQHHLIGIEPDIEVKPTIAGIKAGKDEVLEYAIEYLKKELEK